VQTAGVLLLCVGMEPDSKRIATFTDPEFGADSRLLPKGHVRSGETLIETAVRELREEVGATADAIVGYAGSVLRQSVEYWGEQVLKEIHLFVGVSLEQTRLSANANDTGTVAQWSTLRDAIRLNPWPEERDFLRRLLLPERAGLLGG
jgi:8-oxo-dGTP pyrophosphatase MutT (NUDIX family)